MEKTPKSKCVIVVAYYLNDVLLLNFIREIFKEIRPNDIVIVFNRDFYGETYCHLTHLHSIKGSNRLLDMSGYFEGFLYAKNFLNYSNDSIIIFLNDSLPYKHPYNLIFRYSDRTLLECSKLKYFYCGIPSVLKTEIGYINYFSTYFIISNFKTIIFLSSEIQRNYSTYRRKINTFINLVFNDTWRPQVDSINLTHLLHKKKICVCLEMTLSSIALKENFFIEYQNYKIIKGFRFLIKVKNFVHKFYRKYY